MKETWIEKVAWLKKGEGIAAQGTVPESAEFFQDHFPGFPVLPGVLMLEILKQTAARYLQSAGFSEPSRLRLCELRDVKFTHFLKPGDEWESRVELLSQKKSQMECRGRLSSKDRIAASAKFTLGLMPTEPQKSFARGERG